MLAGRGTLLNRRKKFSEVWRAILTNMHSDLDYEVLRAKLPAHVEPGFDGLTFTAAK